MAKNENLIKSKIRSGAMPTIDAEAVGSIKIVVPPIEVQKRIVNVIDNFEAISSNLKIGLPAEIEARHKQYEFYRDAILEYVSTGKMIHLGGGGVEVENLILILQYVFGKVNIKLSDIAEYSKERIDALKVKTNTYVSVDNLLQNRIGKTVSAHVPKTGSLIKYNKGDILIGNIRPYLKKVWFAENEGGTNGDVLTIHCTNKNVSQKYLYYVLSSDKFFNYDTGHSKGAKMPRGNKNAVMDYEFSLPSLNEQNRVTGILNKFNSLCNDITTGIPAEIKARQKQYEYYRSKLLDFKKLPETESAL